MRFLPRTRFGVFWRAVVGGVVVISCVAAAVTTAGLLKVKDIVGDLNLSKPLSNTGVSLPAPGQPQTLLLVGSDNRYGQGDGESNTDTMMLVRINDSSNTINLLSIPRDLEVQLPVAGGGDSAFKLNAAWELGGPKLLINTLKTQVFPNTNFKVNHILNIDFAGFSDLINAIGCVYTMVDHRYYNNTAQTDYSSINIQPGYQKLCGGSGSNLGGPNTALAFVRFRHTDSDLVREARQQDFLRWAKDAFSTAKLESEEGKLLKIFGKHVSTDGSLHTTAGLIELFDLALDANGHDLKDFEIPNLGNAVINGEDYLTEDTADAVKAYNAFMTPTAAKPATSKPKTAKKKKTHATTVFRVPSGMSADVGDGNSQAAQMGKIPLPVYFPKYIPSDAAYCFSLTGNCLEQPNPPSEYTNSYPRRYQIRGSGDKRYRAYVFTLVINMDLGEYFNVEGTTWQHPPILNRPTKVQSVNGKKLYEFYDGGNLSLVAWHTTQGVYWIANTLRDDIPNNQMIAMAASFTRADR